MDNNTEIGELESALAALSLNSIGRVDLTHPLNCWLPSSTTQYDDDFEMKRERMEQDDDPEIMPLSKRMNNIHFGVPSTEDHRFHSPGPGGRSPGPSDQYMQYVSTLNSSQLHNDVQHNNQQRQSGTNSTIHSVEYHNQNVTISPDIKDSLSIVNNSPNSSVKDIEYAPLLNRNDNPIYYDQNRMLFELYRERLIRNNYPPHPNFGHG